MDRRASGAGARSGQRCALPFNPQLALALKAFDCDCDSDELRLDRDIAVRRPGIRTNLVRRLDQVLRHVWCDAGQADIQADRDIEAVAVRSEVDLCIDREVGGSASFILRATSSIADW